MQALTVTADWDPKPGYPVAPEDLQSRRALDASSVWRHPRWNVLDVEVPIVIGDHDVLVKVKACGMCGSDLHMYESDDAGYMLLPFEARIPLTIGHEFSGEVVQVGKEVTNVRLGDAVAAEPTAWCGACRACAQGLFNHCSNARHLGFTRSGGAAEYVVVPAKHCWSLNRLREEFGDSKAYDIGALIEPTSVAYTGIFLRAGGFLPGANVVVFGCGPVGLAAVALIRAAGAGLVVAVDMEEERRKLAQKLGADAVLDPSALAAAGSSVGSELLDLTRGAGVSVAVEATGSGARVMPEIETALGFAGKVVLLGLEHGAVPVRLRELQLKAAGMYGSLGHIGGFEGSIALHAAGRLDLSPMITARYPLEAGVEAIQRAVKRVDAKILLYPGRGSRDSLNDGSRGPL